MLKNMHHSETTLRRADGSVASTALRQIVRLPGELMFILAVFLLWMLLFSLFRAGLLLSNAYIQVAVNGTNVTQSVKFLD